MNKEKNVLVSFSGGLDSTYLVYHNLKKGYYVTGLYTTIENNNNKAQVEKYQIEKITELLMQEFPGKFTLHYGISIDVPFSGELIFKQIAIWLISLLYHDPNYDEVQIGAVMNDDMLSYIDDIKKLWGSFSFLNKKHPPLVFPLIKTSKFYIARELPKAYRDLVVYCENPIIIEPITKKNKEVKFENCGQCHSCKRYKFDSDYLDIQYGRINPKWNNEDKEPIPDYPRKLIDVIMPPLQKPRKLTKTKITIQKAKRTPLPMPMTGCTMDSPFDASPVKKRKRNDIRRPKKR